jgi:hypothetical protein
MHEGLGCMLKIFLHAVKVGSLQVPNNRFIAISGFELIRSFCEWSRYPYCVMSESHRSYSLA